MDNISPSRNRGRAESQPFVEKEQETGKARLAVQDIILDVSNQSYDSPHMPVTELSTVSKSVGAVLVLLVLLVLDTNKTRWILLYGLRDENHLFIIQAD